MSYINRSDELKQIEFEIIGFGNRKDRRVVGGLTSELDQLQRNSRVVRRAFKHFEEQLIVHKMRAGAGRKITAAF